MKKSSYNIGYILFLAVVAACGGFLFGYDTAVISGTIKQVTTLFGLNDIEQGWYVGCALVGSIAGVAVAGTMSDWIGRRLTMIFASIMFSVSAIGCALCGSYQWLVFYRIVGGIGIGIVSIVSPMYISEIAVTEYRGRLVSLYQLAITVGFLGAYLINYWLLSVSESTRFDSELMNWIFVDEVWRGMLGMETLPALLFFIILFIIPESPRWLLLRGKVARSESIFGKIYSRKERVKKQVEELQAHIANETKSEFKYLFQPGILTAVVAGLCIAILGQFMGVNAVLYYGPTIFENAGLSGGDSLFYQVLIGVVNMGTTILALLIIDKIGRKKLVYYGVSGMIVSLLLIAFYFSFGESLGLSSILMLIFFLLYVFCTAVSISAVYNRVLADEIREKNEALQLVYKELQKEKEKNIYYVPSQALIGDDYEATVDGIHFTDLGQFRYAECIGDCLERAFRKNIIKDLSLIYQGGINRMDWTEEQFRPYVMHQFQDGRKEWLFDGFLFLEFSDGKGRRYAQGYGKDARKQEWEWLLQRLFEEGKSLSALDACIETVKKEIGEPEFRHRVVIGLPAAMFRQRDWGELNGKTLCFLYREDQVAATRWYVDRVLESFRNANYKNLDLAGFYWVDEDIAYNGDLSLSVSEYIHSKNLLFYWIPYWKAVGYDKWRELGFDMAYLQPNHFFEENIPDSRLEEACKESEKNGMAIEMEFDSRALSDYEPVSFRSRMKSYIDVFKDNGVFFDLPIAYYSGSRAIYEMYKSEDERDKEIMDELCELIVERHKK